MTENKPLSALVIPFGKYKGATVAELLAKDAAYAEWIVNQNWMAERFAELHAAILSRGAAPDDTPEHNAVQARFLDETFRIAAVLAARPYPQYSICCNFPELLAKIEGGERLQSSVRFEERNVDVTMDWWVGKPGSAGLDGRIFIEIKPSMGDDFPSVMRQMARLRASVLVLGEYTGSAVPLPQVREMFAANNQTVLMIRDIEAEMANTRAASGRAC